MFALTFQFPAGRYHATPWGRNVNEGDVAWPPEPYRILRALIATWHRKADQAIYERALLSRLIETLARTDPVFVLPDAIHAHTRHYMPQGGLAKTAPRPQARLRRLFQSRSRGGIDRRLAALDLARDLFALAGYLAERIGYLGRAESLVIARVSDAKIEESRFNAAPSGRLNEGNVGRCAWPPCPPTRTSPRGQRSSPLIVTRSARPVGVGLRRRSRIAHGRLGGRDSANSSRGLERTARRPRGGLFAP